jgi:hypothetical protein
MPCGSAGAKDLGKNLLLLVVTVGATVLACEAAYRRLNHVSLLDFSNFTLAARESITRSRRVRPDDLLGWAMRDGVNTPGVHTVDHGVRRNDAAQTGTRHGGVLAVGSSFTFGAQVDDEQTWPAQLERLTGQPVDNAAVSAYGLDQVVLRAEQLLPVTEPKAVLVGLTTRAIRWTIDRAGAGGQMPKPFFTVERDVLVAHGVAESLRRIDGSGWMTSVLGHSLLFDRAFKMASVSAPWQSRTGIDATVDLNCRLLQRLKQTADMRGARAILVFEPWFREAASGDGQPQAIRRVEACAGGMGYAIVDVSAGFSADAAAEPDGLGRYYVQRPGGDFDHFSDAGNRRVAELVAEALRTGSGGAEPGAK